MVEMVELAKQSHFQNLYDGFFLKPQRFKGSSVTPTKEHE